jgi:hypothetical protein
MISWRRSSSGPSLLQHRENNIRGMMMKMMLETGDGDLAGCVHSSSSTKQHQYGLLMSTASCVVHGSAAILQQQAS